VLDEAIARVMALGFEHQQALEALLKTNGDVGKASMMLSGTEVSNHDITQLLMLHSRKRILMMILMM